MIEILGVQLSKIPPKAALEEWLDRDLYSAWQTQHAGLHRADARRASLVGILLLQAAGVVGKLSYDKRGRPYLLDASVDFNVTHTDGYVFCAIERCDAENIPPEPRVGIDAEDVSCRKKARRADMALRWFSADEQRLFFADPTEARFLEIWTRKEALVKWQGEGMRALSNADTESAEQTYGVRFQSYFEGDAIITLCHRAEADAPDTVHMLGDDELERLCEKKRASILQ